MHILISSVVVTLWMFGVYPVDGVLVLTSSGNKFSGSKTYGLKCEIPGFTNQALWSKAGNVESNCFNSGCFPPSSSLYTFRVDSTAIYVDFKTLTENEDDILWTCAHQGDNAVNITVQVDKSETTTDGLSAGAVAAIVVTCLILIGVIAFICYRHLVPKVCIIICYYEFPSGFKVVLLVDVESVTTVTSISWQKKVGNEFVQIDSNSLNYQGSTPEEPSLTILDVCPDDSAEYQCLATNTFGTGRSTKTTSLFVPAKAKEYEAQGGSKVDLLLDLCDLKNVKSVKWEHSSQQLPRIEDLIYKGGSIKHPSLTIRWVSLEDVGLWRCSMETQTSKRVIDVQLKMKEHHIESISASNVKLIPGSSEIETTFIKSVQWKHDDKLCTTDEHLHDNPSCHAITLACLEDAGKWHCKIEFEYFQIKTFDVRLTVKERHMEAKVGSKVVLLPELCDINDIEKVEWQHNDKAPDKPCNFKEDGHPSYTIEEAAHENSGMWHCILQLKKAKKRKTTFSVFLDVKDKRD